MKTILKIALIAFPLVAFCAEQSQPKTYPNPANFSKNRQNCNLIIGVISVVPIWRENKVPISRAHGNVEDILQKIEANDEDKVRWHHAVDQLYGSKVSSEQMTAQLRPMCEKIP